MKNLLFFAVTSLFASVVLADTTPWPDVIRCLRQDDFKPVIVADLPEGVALYHHPDDEKPGFRAKRTVHIASVHLSDSAAPELLVQADDGGTGGAYYDVYRKLNGTYQNIGWLGAGYNPKLLSKENGYCQIEIWTHGGAGLIGRRLYQFKQGKYSSIREMSYQMQEMAMDNPDLNRDFNRK